MDNIRTLIRATPFLSNLLLFAVLSIAVWIIARTIRRQLNHRIPDSSSRHRARKAVNAAAYLLILILFATIYSDNMSDLTVALGVAGAGIAFALQEVIVSFAGWLTIMAGNFYKTGDRIELGGIRGDVMDIGVLRTTLMETGSWVGADLYNGRIVMIANSHVFKQPVFNLSGRFPFLWDEIRIPVAFGSDQPLARQLFFTVTTNVVGEITSDSLSQWHSLQKRYYLEDAQTSPMVTMAITDNWVEYTIRYVVSYRRRRQVQDLLHQKILEAVDNTNGRVHFGSTTVHLVDTPDNPETEASQSPKTRD